MKLHHINIKAPMVLLEREKAFFCDLLGLREGHRPRFSSRGFWLYDGDDAIVHLSENDVHAGDGSTGHLDHVAFQARGVKDLVRRLDAAGTEFVTAHVPELDMTQVFVVSPTGTRIEVNFIGENPPDEA